MSAVLVIAGSDSSGGAGLARDLRTLAICGVPALCAITAVTAQSDSTVLGVHHVPPSIIKAQIAAALASGRVGAIKIGMLGTRATVLAVAESLGETALPLVLDPVLRATSGGELLDDSGREALRDRLLPRTTLLTPNIPEAAALLGVRESDTEADLLAQGKALLCLGPAAVLIKGGHRQDREATDVLFTAGAPPLRFSAPREPQEQRGTGCALSTAIAAGLAQGLDLAGACARAKAHVTELLRHGD